MKRRAMTTRFGRRRNVSSLDGDVRDWEDVGDDVRRRIAAAPPDNSMRVLRLVSGAWLRALPFTSLRVPANDLGRLAALACDPIRRDRLAHLRSLRVYDVRTAEKIGLLSVVTRRLREFVVGDLEVDVAIPWVYGDEYSIDVLGPALRDVGCHGIEFEGTTSAIKSLVEYLVAAAPTELRSLTLKQAIGYRNVSIGDLRPLTGVTSLRIAFDPFEDPGFVVPYGILDFETAGAKTRVRVKNRTMTFPPCGLKRAWRVADIYARMPPWSLDSLKIDGLFMDDDNDWRALLVLKDVLAWEDVRLVIYGLPTAAIPMIRDVSRLGLLVDTEDDDVVRTVLGSDVVRHVFPDVVRLDIVVDEWDIDFDSDFEFRASDLLWTMISEAVERNAASGRDNVRREEIGWLRIEGYSACLDAIEHCPDVREIAIGQINFDNYDNDDGSLVSPRFDRCTRLETIRLQRPSGLVSLDPTRNPRAIPTTVTRLELSFPIRGVTKTFRRVVDNLPGLTTVVVHGPVEKVPALRDGVTVVFAYA